VREKIGIDVNESAGAPATLNVRLWHKADMLNALTNVRFWGESGHGAGLSLCPLMTQSGHSHNEADSPSGR